MSMMLIPVAQRRQRTNTSVASSQSGRVSTKKVQRNLWSSLLLLQLFGILLKHLVQNHHDQEKFILFYRSQQREKMRRLASSSICLSCRTSIFGQRTILPSVSLQPCLGQRFVSLRRDQKERPSRMILAENVGRSPARGGSRIRPASTATTGTTSTTATLSRSRRQWPKAIRHRLLA